MSKQVKQLEAQLSECYRQISELQDRANELRDKIQKQQLIDWMQANDIDTSITEVPMNHEMHDYIVKHGFPGGYIEYELEKWAIGTPMILRSKYESEEGSICAGPVHNHSGLFPPDMIKRAIAELEQK